MRSGVHPWRVVTTTIATVISLMLTVLLLCFIMGLQISEDFAQNAYWWAVIMH